MYCNCQLHSMMRGQGRFPFAHFLSIILLFVKLRLSVEVRPSLVLRRKFWFSCDGNLKTATESVTRIRYLNITHFSIKFSSYVPYDLSINSLDNTILLSHLKKYPRLTSDEIGMFKPNQDVFLNLFWSSLSFILYYCRRRCNGSVAEWSKALDLGSSLSGGVGSNPTAIILFFLKSIFYFIYFNVSPK